MTEAFAAKLSFLLKFLSLSRSQLAAELQVDKSIVGRWVGGGVRPSAHNLARLTALIATRVQGFTVLDWDRSLDGLADRVGVSREPAARSQALAGLPLVLLDQIVATTALRGGAYEGFFKSTRPYAAEPGRFIHDHAMVRLDDNGLLRLSMGTGGVFVDAWLLPLQTHLYCVGCELTSGSLVFGIFNAVPSVRADIIDGLSLTPILDIGRTPTALPVVFRRIGELTGDRDADDRRFAGLADLNPLATDESAPAAVRAHLARDFGPTAFAAGEDWVLRSPAHRSMSSGRLTD